MVDINKCRDMLIEAGFNHDDIDYNLETEANDYLSVRHSHNPITPEQAISVSVAEAIARDYRARWDEQMHARMTLWRSVHGDDHIPRLD